MSTLVAQLDRTGMVVVGDAMQIQHQRSMQIMEANGDYLWVVKDNQPTLRAEIELLFMPLPALPGTAEVPSDFATAV